MPPPTVIVRHSHENPKKCSVLPLRGRPDLLFLNYPVTRRPDLAGWLMPPAIAGSILLSLAVAYADFRLAESARGAAVEIQKARPPSAH